VRNSTVSYGGQRNHVSAGEHPSPLRRRLRLRLGAGREVLSLLTACAGGGVSLERLGSPEEVLAAPLSRFLGLGRGDALLVPDASGIDWASRATLALLLEAAPRLRPGVLLALGNVQVGVPGRYAGGGQFIVQALGAHSALLKPVWPSRAEVDEASAMRTPAFIVLERR